MAICIPSSLFRGNFDLGVVLPNVILSDLDTKDLQKHLERNLKAVIDGKMAIQTRAYLYTKEKDGHIGAAHDWPTPNVLVGRNLKGGIFTGVAWPVTLRVPGHNVNVNEYHLASSDHSKCTLRIDRIDHGRRKNYPKSILSHDRPRTRFSWGFFGLWTTSPHRWKTK